MRIFWEVQAWCRCGKWKNESESGELQYVRRTSHELSQDYRYYRFAQCCRKYERRGYFISEGHEKQASVTSTVTDVAAGTIDKIAVWENNLTIAPVFTTTDALLNRLKWKITASTNNSNAGKAIDDDASTRWGYKRFAASRTVGDGGHGSWQQKLNRIILDTSKSPNDGPAGYELYLSTGEGDTWKLVASGKNAGSVQIISFPGQKKLQNSRLCNGN